MSATVNALVVLEALLTAQEAVSKIKELNDKRKAEGRDDFTDEEVEAIQNISIAKEDALLGKIS